MKKLIVLLTFILVSPAFAGPGDGGGGDPDAQQFVTLARKLGQFFEENPFHVDIPFSAKAFSKKAALLDASLKDEKAKDLVEFTKETLKCKDQIEKRACFNRVTSSIRVNRPSWTPSTSEDRLILVTMEISGLLKAPLRYETAQALVQGHSAVILAMNIHDRGKFHWGGWRIAGRDPEQFGRLTPADVLIDGGIVGEKPEQTARLGKFLEDPTSDKEWYALVLKAWNQKRPAYLMISGNDGNTVIMTSLDHGKTEDGHVGVVAYSFIAERSREVYEGPCANNGQSLSPLDRLLNCYLDTNNFSYYDKEAEGVSNGRTEAELPVAFRIAANELSHQILSSLASNQKILEAALRDNFIVDYSEVLRPQFYFHLPALAAQAKANGLQPSLSAPGLWKKTNQINQASLRLARAMKALADRNLGIITTGTTCKNAGGNIIGGDLQVLPLSEIRSCERSGTSQSVWTFAPQIESSLLMGMVNAGFSYDYATKTWNQGSAPIKHDWNWQLGGTEIGIRLQTERLTPEARFNVVLSEVTSTKDIKDRVQIYRSIFPTLKDFGFTEPQQERLYIGALKDVMQVKPNQFSGGDDCNQADEREEALGCFAVSTLRAASSNALVNAKVSRIYLNQILRAPWMKSDFLYEIIWNLGSWSQPDVSYPNYREMMSLILARPDANTDVVEDLVADLFTTTYRNNHLRAHGTDRATHEYSYTDRLWVLNQAERLGKITAAVKAELMKRPVVFETRRQLLVAGAGFEAQAAALANPKDVSAASNILMKMLSTPADLDITSEITMDWLARTQPPQAISVKLLGAMLRQSRSLPMEKAVVIRYRIAEAPFILNLAPNIQSQLFNFLLTTPLSSEDVASDRYVLMATLFDYVGPWEISSAQQAIELYASTATAGDGKPIDLHDTKNESSRAALVLDDVQGCKRMNSYESKRFICHLIKSDKAIYQKFANNLNLPVEIRARAREFAK